MDQTIVYILIVFSVSFGLTMLCLIDIILKEFNSTREKILWHFVAIVPLAGWLVYLVFGFRRGKRRKFS
jgi:hypothetical protein